MCVCVYLKDFLPAHLDATVSGLRLLLRQLLPQHLQLLDKVPLVLGDRQTLSLLGELRWRQEGRLLRRRWLLLLLLLERGPWATGSTRDPWESRLLGLG